MERTSAWNEAKLRDSDHTFFSAVVHCLEPAGRFASCSKRSEPRKSSARSVSNDSSNLSCELATSSRYPAPSRLMAGRSLRRNFTFSSGGSNSFTPSFVHPNQMPHRPRLSSLHPRLSISLPHSNVCDTKSVVILFIQLSFALRFLCCVTTGIASCRLYVCIDGCRCV
eukprot:6185732-Pleurochrysis_carterae.AAC.2